MLSRPGADRRVLHGRRPASAASLRSCVAAGARRRSTRARWSSRQRFRSSASSRHTRRPRAASRGAAVKPPALLIVGDVVACTGTLRRRQHRRRWQYAESQRSAERSRHDRASRLLGAVGNTPLIRLDAFSEETGCEILGKAEFMNPGGSVKDRAARAHRATMPSDAARCSRAAPWSKARPATPASGWRMCATRAAIAASS